MTDKTVPKPDNDSIDLKIPNMSATKAIKRIYFRVHGDVQGVYFRQFTKESADRHSLTGWVRNTMNGKVEGEAQGPEEDLKKLLGDINKGSPASNVVKVEKIEREDLKEGEKEFDIMRGSY